MMFLLGKNRCSDPMGIPVGMFSQCKFDEN